MTSAARSSATRAALAAFAVLAPVVVVAGDAGSTRDFVLDFERSGVLKDLLARTLSIARSFVFLSAFVAYFLEAFGRSPLAERDYAAVTWRLVIVLILVWKYQAVFGGVIGILDGLEQQVAPPSTWKAFVKEAGNMRNALDDVAAHGERPVRSESTVGSGASQPTGITAWVYDALIACIQLVAEAAVFLVNWLSRILTATLFVIGPLALVAGIPRVSSTGTRWFVRFVTIASWPIFSGVLLSVLVTLAAQGAVRRTYLECLVAALVMLVTALATPLLASQVIGGALENVSSHGWTSAKAVHREAIRPTFGMAAALGRVVAAGGSTGAAGASASVGAGGPGGGPGSSGGGGAGGPGGPYGGAAGGAVSNPPGRGGGGRGGGRSRRGGQVLPPAQAATAAPASAGTQGGVAANVPAPVGPEQRGPSEHGGRAKGGTRGGR